MKRPAGSLVVMLSLIALSACGVKSAPLPPVIRVADPTRDLAVYQHDRQAVLSWSYPSSTTAGESLHDLESIQVWRATLLEVEAPPPGEKPAERNLNRQLLISNGELVAELDDAALDAATRGSSLVWRDDLDSWDRDNPADGARMIWYAVRSVCCRGRESGLSNIARIVPTLPPQPATDLVLSAEESGVRLRWTPHDELPVLVERTSDGARWRTLGARPVDGPEWLDRSADQGGPWNYRLRSVLLRDGQPRVVGAPGAAVGLLYPDIYPPPAPADLVCLPEGTRVRLRWRASDSDLRYRVYRSTDGKRSALLDEGVSGSQYEDLAPPPGMSIYELTAVDPAGNESEPSSCSAARGASQ